MIRSRKPRAFTLTEMLFILMIMGVASLISARLMRATLNVIATAPASQDQQMRFDHFASALRRDVWGASVIELPDAQTVVLSVSDGAKVQWSLKDGEVIRSRVGSDAPASEQWTMTIPLRAERQGGTLVVRDSSGDSETRFISQMLAAGGTK